MLLKSLEFKLQKGLNFLKKTKSIRNIFNMTAFVNIQLNVLNQCYFSIIYRLL